MMPSLAIAPSATVEASAVSVPGMTEAQDRQPGHGRQPTGAVAPAGEVTLHEAPAVSQAGIRVLPDDALQQDVEPIPYAIARRTLDIVVSGLVLTLSSPILLIIALVIRLDSPGPALFCQYRIGRNGRLFAFYKFRTMYADARDRFPELYRYQYSNEEIQTMHFKIGDDPRLTRFGRRLRKTSADELPNFWNVLRGDMTLVGPRPEIPEMVPYYTCDQLRKFTVTPGVTGLAQISGRAMLRFQETISADLYYIAYRSFWYDLQILLRTVKCVLARNGAC